MVLEALITPVKAEKHPWELFFIGFLLATVSMFVATQIFDTQAALAGVFLTVLGATPFVYHTMKREEMKDLEDHTETYLLKEHSKALSYLVFLFLGTLISFAAWFVLLPGDVANDI